MAIIWTNTDQIHWRIYAALRGDEWKLGQNGCHFADPILAVIGSDNGLSLGRRRAIIWTNAGILLLDP